MSGREREKCSVMTVVNDEECERKGRDGTLKADCDDALGTTFQLDEDAVQALTSFNEPIVLRTQKRRSRRKRLSESLSQPRFADNYRCASDAFLGCGSYGSVYACSSLKSHEQRVNGGKHRTGSQSDRSQTVVGINGGALLEDMNNNNNNSGGSLLGLGGRERSQECEMEEEFAVKIIDKKGHSRSRLFNEMEILHQCKGHPNIIQLLDFYEEDQMFFLIFEKMNGGPLLDHLNRFGAIGERDASLVTKDIATALSFLHGKGIAHRDLKPANILCVYRDSVAPVKICDFDLASAPCTRSVDMPAPNGGVDLDAVDLVSPVGSAEYMAPEVVNVFLGGPSAGAYDKRCDLWSLGVILYIMLCGYPPFVGRCGYPCGWEQGNSCCECQSLLMDAIQRGPLCFPPEDWYTVSQPAISLVCSLLERDTLERATPEQVLEHSWLKLTSAAASNPIPLNPSKIRKSSAASSQFTSQYRTFGDSHGEASQTEDAEFFPERHRLGTEDSGFGGDTVPAVVGLLLDAADDDDSPGGRNKRATKVSGLVNGQCAYEKHPMLTGLRDHQFELSDDESLFSSGYGVSLDLPSVEVIGVEGNSVMRQNSSNDSEFGFENVDKSEIEKEMADSLMPDYTHAKTALGLLENLGIKSRESSRKSSAGSLKGPTAVLADSTAIRVNERKISSEATQPVNISAP